MKKLITTILIVAMIFTMCGTAMAAGETVTADIVIADKASENTVNVTYTGTESLALLKVRLDSELPIASISSNYSYTYNPHNGLVLISCYQTSGTAASPTLTGQGNGTVLFTINYALSSATANGSYDTVNFCDHLHCGCIYHSKYAGGILLWIGGNSHCVWHS